MRVDESRIGLRTGIAVRAQRGAEWGHHDLAELDGPSVVDWLRSDPQLAERVVLALLGHQEIR